ncbi:MAG: dienelactone hydrolase family protein [Pseudorhodobacter sp.]|nr:dienelactone hydrolase family protein [Rhizobacter sp.]
MTLETIQIETAPNPTAAIIVLHGLGADGNDFVPIAQELDLSAIGAVRFVFPHAPVRPVTVNGGYEMRAWYDIYGAELTPGGQKKEDEAGLRASQLAVEEVIAAQVASGIPTSRIVLAGFSQGCAMTLMTGLRHADKLAGLVGLSGYLPLAGLTAAERSPANAATPIFLVHGRQDSVIALARATDSRDALVALGYPIEWHDYPMPHSVCAQEVADWNAWLLRVLG